MFAEIPVDIVNCNYGPFSDLFFHLKHFQTEDVFAMSERSLVDMYFQKLLYELQGQV